MMFSFRSRSSMTETEKAAGKIEYDGQKHQRKFQRAGYKSLQKFRAARPTLAGQHADIFAAIVGVVKGLQAADFDHDSRRADLAADSLESAINGLIHAQPVPFDLETLRAGNAYTLGLVLIRERDKSMSLLSIPCFEVNAGTNNARSYAINDFCCLAAEKEADAGKLLDCINRMHESTVELFLDSFAADVPEPMEEFAAAVLLAQDTIRQAEERQAALGADNGV